MQILNFITAGSLKTVPFQSYWGGGVFDFLPPSEMSLFFRGGGGGSTDTIFSNGIAFMHVVI